MAVIQHLTHTAIFSWMLVEGIHLYIKLVKVFSVKKLYITYIFIGWGNVFSQMGLLFQAISFKIYEVQPGSVGGITTHILYHSYSQLEYQGVFV